MAGNYEKSIYNQLMDVMARLDSVEAKSKQEIFRLNEEISDLKEENRELREENQRLRNDNARLKSIINNDSSNTSLPPSTDQPGGKPANTYNGRTKSHRKAGGQKGHKGTTLTKAAVEEKIRSGKCRHEIRNIGIPSGEKYVTKYIVDLEVVPKITEVRIYPDQDGRIRIPPEYRSDVIYGPDVRALAVSLYSEGVMSNDRIAAFLNAAGGEQLGLSEGSVYGFCKKLAAASRRSIQNLENRLLDQKVVATDATPATVDGKQNYIRNFSIQDTVVYRAMKRKSLPALQKPDFLQQYTGILVHDHETALYHFGTDHGECNVHILRKNTEETGNSWSEEMSGLLKEMNRKRKELQMQGILSFFRRRPVGIRKEIQRADSKRTERE